MLMLLQPPAMIRTGCMDMSERLEWVLEHCRETCDAGREALRTNYYGTKQHFRNEELWQEVDDFESLTEKLDAVVTMFLRDMEAGKAEARGWPVGIVVYKLSKAALNTCSRILARLLPWKLDASQHSGPESHP
ncbi:hypothetical protein ACP4OV_007949 [Aristida adscensionis]